MSNQLLAHLAWAAKVELRSCPLCELVIWPTSTGRPYSKPAMPTFSVIVPTKGRPSLARTLASVAHQLQPGDELIAICTNDNDWGNRARQIAQDKAAGDYLIYVDDDDIFLDGALAAMRAWAESNPGRIGIFQRKSDACPTQPHAHKLTPGMVCPQNFLIPNRPGLVARWGEQSQDPATAAQIAERDNGRYWSDVYMVIETAELQGAEVIFTDIVTGYARPIENPLIRLRYKLAIGRKLHAFLRRVRSLGST